MAKKETHKEGKHGSISFGEFIDLITDGQGEQIKADMRKLEQMDKKCYRKMERK